MKYICPHCLRDIDSVEAELWGKFEEEKSDTLQTLKKRSSYFSAVFFLIAFVLFVASHYFSHPFGVITAMAVVLLFFAGIYAGDGYPKRIEKKLFQEYKTLVTKT